MRKKINKIKVVTIDGDGCLFSYDDEKIGSEFHSSWDALGYSYGLNEKWARRLKRFYKKGVDDDSWARLDVADLKGRDVKKALEVLYPIPYCRGAREFANASKGKLYRGILSTSIDLVARKAYEELGLNFVICNVLNRTNGIFTGTHGHIVPLWRKAEKIEDICRMYNINEKEICHVGDNINDISVGKRVGLFIALKPKTEELKKNSDIVVEDFFEVMEVLGL